MWFVSECTLCYRVVASLIFYVIIFLYILFLGREGGVLTATAPPPLVTSVSGLSVCATGDATAVVCALALKRRLLPAGQHHAQPLNAALSFIHPITCTELCMQSSDGHLIAVDTPTCMCVSQELGCATSVYKILPFPDFTTLKCVPAVLCDTGRYCLYRCLLLCACK